jgi:hypothetical protein
MVSGSEILVKRHASVFAWTSLLGGIGLLAIASFFLSAAWRAPIAAIFFGTFGAIFVLGGTLLVNTVFEFYETGLVMRTLFRAQEVLYADLTSFTFAEEFRYAKGFIPAGRSVEIEFRSANGKPLRLQVSSLRRPEALYALRDRIAAVMAARVREALSQNVEIYWAGGRLSSGQLTVDRPGLFRDHEPLVYRFDSPLEYKLDDRELRISSPSQPGFVVRLPTASENFYPVFHVFRSLVRSA